MTQPTVVRVITWLPVGGIERRLVAVVPRLRDRGWGMRVVCVREEGPLAAELRDAGVPVEVIAMRSRLSPLGLRSLARHFRQHQARIVHSHMYRSNLPATVAARWAGVPGIFAHVHNVDSWESWRQRRMDRAVAGWRTGTFAVSGAVQRDVMQALGLPESKVPVLYNGIDVETFRPLPELGDLVRRQLGVPDDALHMVVPARLHPNKNPLGMLEAFESVAESLPAGTPLPVLTFVGGGKLEGALKSRAAASRVAGQLRFPGSRDDMPAIFNSADVVVLSSFKEGFSNAVVEALACGKPMIASDVGGNREAIRLPDCGWLHDSGDGRTLAAQMREALARGRDGLANMADACRQQACQFSIDALIDNTHRHYCRATGVEP